MGFNQLVVVVYSTYVFKFYQLTNATMMNGFMFQLFVILTIAVLDQGRWTDDVSLMDGPFYSNPKITNCLIGITSYTCFYLF